MKMIVAIAVTLAVMAGGTAHAETKAPRDQRVVRVAIGDLDLNQDAGRITLQRRLNQAVTTICGPRPFTPDLMEQMDWRRCNAEARSNAQRQVASLMAPTRVAQTEIILASNRP